MKKGIFILFAITLAYLFYKSHNFLVISFGVCMFIYAMSVLEKSFSMFADLESFLKVATDKKYKSFLFGLITTGVVQSSGLVSVIAISFTSAGLITLASGLGVIFGANLGTTTGAWLVAGLGLKVDIAAYAMPFMVFGVIFLFNQSTKIKGVGYFLFSIGLLFFGISYMKLGFDSIKETIDLSKYAMSGYLGVIVYTFIGLVATVVMQSSHATLTIAITALGAGQISYENALAIAIGSNIGSTIMAILGSINANIHGKRLTVAHVIFNVISAVIAIIFIDFFVYLVDYSAKFFGISDNDYVLKLAIFHTYFNVVGVLVFYPLTSQMVKFLEKFVVSTNKRSKISTAKYLNESSLEFSQSAKEVLLLETKHLYKNALSILSKALFLNSSDLESDLSDAKVISLRSKPREINYDELYNNRFKELYGQIIDYVIRASKNANDSAESKQFMDIRRASLLLAEILKDMRNIHPNLTKYSKSKNNFIKAEYDKFRVEFLKALRLVDSIMKSNDEKQILALAKSLRIIYKNYNDAGVGSMDFLLSESKITSTMATSLMNDTMLFRNIVKNLLRVVDIVYIQNLESSYDNR